MVHLPSIPTHLKHWLSSTDWSAFPRTAVFGATGRLGSVLRAVWPPEWEATWVGRRPIPGPAITICDPLDDPKGLAKIADKAEVILSLLGPAPGGTLDGNPDLKDHARLAHALKDVATGPVLLASSAAVYGRCGEQGIALSEDMALPTKVSAYGAAKQEMEAASDARALRIANVAGFDAILGGWRPGFELDSFQDGTTPRRSYIGPGTLALALAALCKQAHHLPPILNIAEPGAIEMSALLEAAELPFARRIASEAAIAHVELDTKELMCLVKQLSTPADPLRMVEEVRWVDSLRVGR